jgi:hypothetical protein
MSRRTEELVPLNWMDVSYLPVAELGEVLRVTKPGGDVLFIPGNNDVDDAAHAHLVANGFEWSRFWEPDDGWKRKYWRKK